jgi:hypothetical protein
MAEKLWRYVCIVFDGCEGCKIGQLREVGAVVQAGVEFVDAQMVL